MQLILTYTNGQELEVNVSNVTVEEFVDGARAGYAASAPDRVVINRTLGAQNVVPDVDRYRLCRANGRIALRPHAVCEVSPYSNRYYDKSVSIIRQVVLPPEGPNPDYRKTIVIVLESPHKDEYMRDVSQPIAPAQGSTGSNIQGYLDCVLRKCRALCDELEDEGTRVVLSNPIQFQTSLESVIRWSDWHRVRDAVWGALWNRPVVRNKFRERLVGYSPDIIVNACTGNTRKAQISTFLAKAFRGARRYEADHPAIWHRQDRRRMSRCRDQQ